MSSNEESRHFIRNLEASPELTKTRDDELIVAIPYSNLVKATLEKLRSGVVVSATEPSEELGLALLTLQGTFNAEFPDRIKRWYPKLKEFDPADKVGMVIGAVKQAIAKKSGGWAPTMGRNRLVGHITATDGRVISLDDPRTLTDPGRFPSVSLKSSGSKIKPVVGIADTPFWPHRSLVGRVKYDESEIPEPVINLLSPGKSYRTAHSTFVAGLVLAQAPEATVLVKAALNSDGFGDTWSVAKKIVSFNDADPKISILNLSFSCYTGDAEPPLALAAAIDRLDPEIVVVAGAGNYAARIDFAESYPGSELVDLSIAPAWPAALDDVVAVGATVGETTRRADFSPSVAWVDLLAPGDPVRSTFVDENWSRPPNSKDMPEPSTTFAEWSGTSFSTAIVSGEIARRMSTNGLTARAAWGQLRKSIAEGSGGSRAAIDGPRDGQNVLDPRIVADFILGRETSETAQER